MAAQSFRWIGAKVASGKVGKWLLAQMPWSQDQIYAELYAGSAQILLAREPTQQEILNDLNDRIHNFFEVCREQPDELERLWHYTPWSETTYYEAYDKLDDGNPIVRAWAFLTRCQIGFGHEVSRTRGYSVFRENGIKQTRQLDFYRIAGRLRQVQITCRDAMWHLERLEGHPNAFIYLDPPYHSTDAENVYRHAEIDIPAIAEAVQAQKGKVAISGWGDEWDMLGWEKHVMSRSSSGMGAANDRRDVAETLWTNYEANRQERLL